MNAPRSPQYPAPARLLVDLVSDPVDPGYRAAAARRAAAGPAARRTRWADRLLVVVGAALIGFVAVVAYVHTHRGAPEAQKVHDRLVDRVRGAQRDTDSLAADANGLQRRITALRDSALPQGRLADELSQAQLDAGQVAVHGPGISVTLREPKHSGASPSAQRAGSLPIDATHILTDRDVRSVVNELWHDGAEAIEVNGVRLTPTSAIRFAGEAVLVDFSPITAPYRIGAIGDTDELATAFAQSAVASRYQTLVGVDHIGFTVHDEHRVDAPAAAPVSPRYARAVPSSSTARTSPSPHRKHRR